MSSTTRERIVDEAMLLFSQNGYAATSVAKIEAAAGLTPGAGGIYHHFASKEALLAAGIERQLARLGALREIRNVLGSLGDLKAELTLTARYVLAELDRESELLRILASDARRRPQVLTAAVDELVSSTFTGFANWIGESAERKLLAEHANAIAAVGLGSLLSSRLLRDVLGVPALVDDEALVTTWVQTMLAALASAADASAADASTADASTADASTADSSAADSSAAGSGE
jgi:AcrR family transcriptional regulator